MLAVAASGATAPANAAPSRPNIVIVQTDDQTADSVRYMEETLRLLGEKGATFRSHYANWPICCPSRATMLTGQYAHNHGVRGNNPPGGGFKAFDNSQTTAVWLDRRGYVTAHVGKFLNRYGEKVPGPDRIPPGWDEWYTLDDDLGAYEYTQNENGEHVAYGSDAEDYGTDVHTAQSVALIDEHVGAGRPLYMHVDYTAPHRAGPDPLPQPPANCSGSTPPAPRHAHAFDSEPLPQDPSFNEADVSDKPEAVQALPLLDAPAITEVTRHYRCRIESLLAVDEGVAAIAEALRDHGALDETYLLFTSDNGFYAGEHRIPFAKTRVYEPASRIPLLMRGPGVPRGAVVRDLTINADIAPTVVAASGAKPRLVMDGRSLLPIAASPWRERGRSLLIDTREYKAVHTARYVWVEYRTGERELYDLHADPFQLESAHRAQRYGNARRALKKRLREVRGCRGAGCRTSPALRMELVGERRGSGCLSAPAVARVEGNDVRLVDLAEFFVGSRLVREDRTRPFRERLHRGELGGPGRAVVRARATLIDGRRISWQRDLRVCR